VRPPCRQHWMRHEHWQQQQGQVEEEGQRTAGEGGLVGLSHAVLLGQLSR